MASHGPTESKYRSALSASSDLLTKADVERLVFLNGKIVVSRQAGITNGTELFKELESLKLLSKDDVTTLIGWMEELQLIAAAAPLEEYAQWYSTHGGQKRAPMDAGNPGNNQPSKLPGRARSQSADDVTQQECPHHPDHPLAYVCVPCDTKICSECAMTSHKRGTKCDVFRIGEISAEVKGRGAKLLTEIEEALSRINSAEESWEVKRKEEMAKLDIQGLSDLDDMIEKSMRLQYLKGKVEYMKSTWEESMESSLRELRRIGRATNELKEIRVNIDQTGTGIVDTGPGQIGGLGGAKFVLSVSIHSEQMIYIHDARRVKKDLLLVCVDPRKPEVEHWRERVSVDDPKSPVVMSYTAIWYDRMNHILLAAGKTVYNVLPRYDGSLFVSVECISSLQISGLPAGSHITSIAGSVETNRKPEKKFLISTSVSTMLREYDVSGSPLRSIETRRHIPSGSIIDIAYTGNTISVISRDQKDVTVLTVDGTTVTNCCSIRPPAAGLIPVMSAWCRRWLLVLYTSGGRGGGQWKVVKFNLAGHGVLLEGTYSNYANAPVRFCLFGESGYVTFANGKVSEFNLSIT